MRRALQPAVSAHAPARYCPVPVKGSACGLPVLLSYTRKLADSTPTMEGVKYIVNVQTAPGASAPAQGGLAALLVKSRLLVPVMAQALKYINAPPTFVMVTVEETWCPTAEVPKLTEEGVNSTPVRCPTGPRFAGWSRRCPPRSACPSGIPPPWA